MLVHTSDLEANSALRNTPKNPLEINLKLFRFMSVPILWIWIRISNFLAWSMIKSGSLIIFPNLDLWRDHIFFSLYFFFNLLLQSSKRSNSCLKNIFILFKKSFLVLLQLLSSRLFFYFLLLLVETLKGRIRPDMDPEWLEDTVRIRKNHSKSTTLFSVFCV